jgi:hypothetical protein
LHSEEKVLAYDTQEHGYPDFVEGSGEMFEETAMQVMFPDDNDPVGNGWVGSDGLP